VRAIVHAGEMALTRDLLSEMPRLGLIACVSVGYDGVDVPWCKAHGIAVTHSTGLNAADVADHAVGLVLAAWRGIVEGDHRCARATGPTPSGWPRATACAAARSASSAWAISARRWPTAWRPSR
jgi:lactate dehydrogenase-like 2-hydroxyacid dehydrogenase